jgi:cytosine/adenosine deaminase-related metal-dependent hydrolase
MSHKILIKNPLIVSMDAELNIYRSDILIEDNIISQIAGNIRGNFDEQIDAQEYIVTPGFIQTHVHLCQTLFRNMAEDLTLLDWLNKKIWPYESMHTPETLTISAELGIAELIKSGTTTIMDMGTVHYHDAVFETLSRTGMRAVSGKTMMDTQDTIEGLKETTAQSIDESLQLFKKWHNYDNGRLKYAFAPRFVLSCTEELLIETGRLSKEKNTLLHTHASENPAEIEEIKAVYGMGNIEYFKKIGISGGNLCLAHCVWLNEKEKTILREDDVKVLHCPSANLKLASGIAPIPEYIENGITVSVGADGAPCNNNLNIFNEMRLAGLIQRPKYGVNALPGSEILKMATINGAKTLHQENEIGSIETGKKADITFIHSDELHSQPLNDVYNKIIYSTSAADVEKIILL